MAQKVEVTLIDDLDGGKADETISFSLDGAQYVIDLSLDAPVVSGWVLSVSWP